MNAMTTNKQIVDALKAAGHSDAQIKIMLVMLESRSEGKAARQCACGCGGMTKGGKYRPGHDAKHLSATLKELRGETVVIVKKAEKKVAKVAKKAAAPEVLVTAPEVVTEVAAAV